VIVTAFRINALILLIAGGYDAWSRLRQTWRRNSSTAPISHRAG
jgi:hypothetical protein